MFLRQICPKILTRPAAFSRVKHVCGTIHRQYSEETSPEKTQTLPSHARVVIGGGGVIGASVAYHLAERGWNDVLLLEQGSYSCGTSWHAAGLVGQLREDGSGMRMHKYGRDLYSSFEKSGHGVGWKQCGSVNVARTKDRLVHLKRKHAMAQANGIETHMISPKDAKEKCPWIRHEDLEGAMWIPSDGVISPTDLVNVYMKLAKEKGVRGMQGVQINKVVANNFQVSHVETSLGNIGCEIFVNCSGQWARELGEKTFPRVRVPLHSCEHFYLVTQPISGMDPMMPVVRDHDGEVYFREWSGGMVGGGFEARGKPVFHNGIPEKFEYQLLPEDWDHFERLMKQILFRMPILEEAQVRMLLNGPESFTPDGQFILGESPEVENYFVAAGMNSSGIASSAGVGKHMSEYIIDRHPSCDLSSRDIKRFVQHHNNRKFLRDRVSETIGQYRLRYPFEQWTTGRNLRTSPLHTHLEVAGGYFGETNAYERAMWFNSNPEDRHYNEEESRGTFGKPSWHNCVRDEYWACKERVCLIDMSAFSKIEIKSAGTEALGFLQYICSNDVDQGVGTVVHTGMQNYWGGYENDCSIIPIEDNVFLVIAPTSQQTRCLAWLHKHKPKDGSVMIRDVTSMYSGINVIGPHAEQLLADLTDISTTLKDFKPMTCKVIDVGHASGIRAMRLTHCGEDGFILYVPSEYALHVYDALMNAGQDYGIRNAGYHALRHLRIEKFFGYWGIDLTTHVTPLECGRDFRVKFDKGDFIGKDALVKQREEGVPVRFAQCLLEDFDLDLDMWPWGGEPIYRNGKYVGSTTTTGYGFTLERMVCLGFIGEKDEQGRPVLQKKINDFILDKNAKYEIDIAGKRFPAKVGIYTPKAALTSSKPVFIPVPSKD